MELCIQLPNNTNLTEEKIKAIDRLCAVFPPEELSAFFSNHQFEMLISDPEQIEMRDAIAELLKILENKIN